MKCDAGVYRARSDKIYYSHIYSSEQDVKCNIYFHAPHPLFFTLQGLSKLYTALVWESTILLALCNGQPLPCHCEKHGKAHQLESLIPGLIEAGVESGQAKASGAETVSNSVTTAMEALSTDSPSSAPMEMDELVETFSGDNKGVKTKLTQSQQAQIKQIKPLLSGSSRLGRALAELFGLLVKVCLPIDFLIKFVL